MEILIGALFLSIWHSILFWKQEIGISAILFAIPTLLITIKLLKGRLENQKALLLSIPIVLLSITYLIFDNSVFQILNLIIIPILYVIMIIIAISKSPEKSIISKIGAMIIEPLSYFGEVVRQIKEQIWPKSKEWQMENKQDRDFVKAIFFTSIIVIIVLLLLISADNEFAELFGGILDKIVNLSIPSLIYRIAVIIALFLYIAGFFINMSSKYNVLKDFEEDNNKPKESFTIHMMITALNIVYLVFCYTQIKSLFTVENITYSYYARKGFFQLMIVSLINLVMILKATDKRLLETPKQTKYKKIMCIIMVIFTLLIIISAFARMTLYQQHYGDTRLRILVDFALITEIILLVPTIIYILKPRLNLVKSYFIIITVMYCIINFVNIDYMIAKNNIDRFIETGKIDLRYITTELDSADTMEELIRLKQTEFKQLEKYYINSNRLNENKLSLQKSLDDYLSDKSAELNGAKINEENTWPEFNLSKWKARNVLNKMRED